MYAQCCVAQNCFYYYSIGLFGQAIAHIAPTMISPCKNIVNIQNSMQERSVLLELHFWARFKAPKLSQRDWVLSMCLIHIPFMLAKTIHKHHAKCVNFICLFVLFACAYYFIYYLLPQPASRPDTRPTEIPFPNNNNYVNFSLAACVVINFKFNLITCNFSGTPQCSTMYIVHGPQPQQEFSSTGFGFVSPSLFISAAAQRTKVQTGAARARCCAVILCIQKPRLACQMEAKSWLLYRNDKVLLVGRFHLSRLVTPSCPHFATYCTSYYDFQHS